MFVFNEIYKGGLLSMNALGTIIAWTIAQQIHCNDLSNVINQHSCLTFWQHETLKTNQQLKLNKFIALYVSFPHKLMSMFNNKQ